MHLIKSLLLVINIDFKIILVLIGGLIYTQYYVFIINAVSPLFTQTIDFPFLIKKIKIFYYKTFASHKLTQKEANKLVFVNFGE